MHLRREPAPYSRPVTPSIPGKIETVAGPVREHLHSLPRVMLSKRVPQGDTAYGGVPDIEFPGGGLYDPGASMGPNPPLSPQSHAT